MPIEDRIVESLMLWARTWCDRPTLEFTRDANGHVLCEVRRPFSAAAPLSSLHPVAITRVQ